MDTGDVEIRLTRKPEDRLLLHSVVLGLHSTWFKASLSDRWAKGTPSSQSDIKWSYELRFDSHDETPALVKRPLSNDPPSNTYFNKGSTPAEALTLQQFETRNNLIRAYRCYFGVILYEPLDDFVDSSPEKVLDFLHKVAKIADYYDGSSVLTCHIENYLNRKAVLDKNTLIRQAPLLLGISIKLKSGPLFKDAICHLAGDETRDDKKIETDLDPRMASLVLRKRDGLRQMMREIDNKLLSFTTEYDEDSEDTCGGESLLEDQGFVTACFRQFIAKRMFERNAKKWSYYAMKYRKLVADVSRMKLDKRFFRRHFRCSHSERAAHSLYGRYYREAIQMVWPLFASSLSQHVKYTPNPLRYGYNGEGFTCVEVLDEDLPWQKG
ncbi:MAG: hypothetical protein Q9209_005115 [Squamulea sp. 1 TL-2023]